MITDCSYGGTNRAARKLFAPWGIEFTFVDFTDPANVEKAMKPNTKLIFSETPANPTLTLTDLRAVSDIAKKHGVKHCCDSTFATPLMLRPLDLGVDITLHSTTKCVEQCMDLPVLRNACESVGLPSASCDRLDRAVDCVCMYNVSPRHVYAPFSRQRGDSVCESPHLLIH